MVRRCQVCKKLDYSSPELSFHRFPKDVKQRNIWFGILGINHQEVLIKNPELCSDHFDPRNIILKNGRKFLKPGALPELNPPIFMDESSSSSDSSLLASSPTRRISNINDHQDVKKLEDSNWNNDIFDAGPSKLIPKQEPIKDFESSISSSTLTASEQEDGSENEELLNLTASEQGDGSENEESSSLTSSEEGDSPEKEKLTYSRDFLKLEKRKRGYVGDLSSSDFSTPRKRRKNVHLLKSKVSENRSKIHALQMTVGGLKRKITSLQALLSYLKEKSLITENSESTIKEISCTDCDCRGPNLWLCLKRNCGHIGCAEKSNDHSTIHNAKEPSHCLHMNLSTRRVWCYECKWEVFLDQHKRQTYNSYKNDQEEVGSITFNKDSGHGSYTTLRANSPNRGAIFENGVGLNVGMSGDGNASDSSDIGEPDDYTLDTSRKGLVGLQNIGNTCYMNAALQALSNTEPLTRYFLDCSDIVHILSEGKKPGLSRTYQGLIRDMWVKKNTQGFVTPSGILYGIRNVHAMFRGYHQHDTQEFLRNFMDQLHEELKQPVGPENLNDCDTFSLINEENHNTTLTYDSSEGEYETCDSGVSERSSLSDDSEAHQVVTSHSERKLRTAGNVTTKRRLSRCQSPSRRQRPRVTSQSVIDSQPCSNQSNPRKQIKYHSIISDIFDGKLLSSVQCLTCDRISSRVETFQDLSLPIPSRDHLVLLHGRAATPNAACSDVVIPVQDGWISWILAWLRYWWYGPVVTLHDCLAAFFSTDELKGDNMYSCEKCNKLRNGIKFSKVLQLPEVLCIHLKRFRHELMYSSKILSAVSFPLKGLDMWPYLHVNNTSKVSNYDLFSVICHHGTAGGGHYTCFALNGGQWYEFDDQYVTRVSADRVQNCEAYVLFYRKVQTSAEGVRHKANKMGDEAEHKSGEIKKAHISRQWLNRFYYCVEPGPIDNSDFLCQHGAFDPDKELVLDYLTVEIPLEMYDYLHKRFGGCPPVANPVICPACSALQQRIVNEMESFLEISRKTQAEHWPHTHYLSTSWYLKWHAFVEKKTMEPPGPIDNSKIDPDHIDIDEAADVPQPIWDFFHSIYGGGPTIFIDLESDGEGDYPPYESDGEIEPEENKANEMGDGPTTTETGEPSGLGRVDRDGSTERMETESNPGKEKPCSSEMSSENLEGFDKPEPTSRKVDGDCEVFITDDATKKVQISKRGKYRRRNK